MNRIIYSSFYNYFWDLFIYFSFKNSKRASRYRHYGNSTGIRRHPSMHCAGKLYGFKTPQENCLSWAFKFCGLWTVRARWNICTSLFFHTRCWLLPKCSKGRHPAAYKFRLWDSYFGFRHIMPRLFRRTFSLRQKIFCMQQCTLEKCRIIHLFFDLSTNQENGISSFHD